MSQNIKTSLHEVVHRFNRLDADGKRALDLNGKCVIETEVRTVKLEINIDKLLARIASQALNSKTGISKFIGGAIVVRRV